MKIIVCTVSFRCDDEVQEDDVAGWLDDMLDLVVDYDAFEDATGSPLDELPEVIDFNSHMEI